MIFKRLIDFSICFVALLVLSPLLIFCAFMSLVLQGRPIIFTQKRVGYKNRIFSIIKFRTMSLDESLPENERIKWWGKFLRKTSIDELPEILNILKGEMSIVGPRPLLVEYLPFYSKEQIKRHDVLPGLTGLAQINGRNGLTWSEKFKFDLEYVEKQSLWMDFKIIIKTFSKVLFADDINSSSQLSMARFDNPFYIVGAGGHGKAVAAVCERSRIDIHSFMDDQFDPHQNKKVLGYNISQKIDAKATGRALIAIGNNKFRKQIANQLALDWQTVICPSSTIHPSAKIGKGSIIMSNVHIGPMVVIGEHCIINNGVNLEHDTYVDSFTHIAPNSVLCGGVKVGQNSFVGANSTIKNNISINSDVTVGAGSTVIKSIKEPGTYVGSPVRKLEMSEKSVKSNELAIKMASPVIEQDDIDAVVDVLKSGHLSLGPKIIEFEKRFCEYTGCKHAIAVSSGTAGLHLSLLSMGIGPGDEVIVPSFTFVSSVSTIVHVGATPVFIDIEDETYCIDPKKVEELITPNTKALLAVDVFGHPADWTGLNELAKKHNLYTIDDSCEALGSFWDNKKIGSFADTSVFAFYPNKQITTGEGGIIVTDDDDLANKLRMFRNHGRSNMGKWLKHDFIGYNYRMNEMSAALGVSQMKKLDKILKGREDIAEKYNSYLNDFEHLRTQVIKDRAKMSWFVYVVTLRDGISRDKVITELQESNIPARAYFEPIHNQPMMEKVEYRSGTLEVTENIARRTIALPFHANMTDTEVEYIAMTIKKIVNAELSKNKLNTIAA